MWPKLGIKNRTDPRLYDVFFSSLDIIAKPTQTKWKQFVKVIAMPTYLTFSCLIFVKEQTQTIILICEDYNYSYNISPEILWNRLFSFNKWLVHIIFILRKCAAEAGHINVTVC